MKSTFVTLILLWLTNGVAISVVITPVADVTVSGGQYYLEDTPSSFGGNLSLYFAPAVTFATGDTLIPVFSALYRGTRDVRELIGGDALVRQTADYGLNLKYTRGYGPSDISARLVYGKSLVNETRDETWGSGLFDYTRMLGGLEYSRDVGPYHTSLAADYFSVTFDNYSSLVSSVEDEFSLAIDTTTYSEISENSGVKVLDYRGLAFSARAETGYGRTCIRFGYRFELRSFPDQTVVRSDGSFSPEKRGDTVNSFTASALHRAGRAELGLENSLTLFSSNQNSFDAGSAKFMEDFYSYTLIQLAPSAAFYIGNPENPSRLAIRWDIGWRLYSGRPARDARAEYLDEKVRQSEKGLGLSYMHPVTASISLILRAGKNTVSSNMKYEADYRYNYTTMNYFAGMNLRY